MEEKVKQSGSSDLENKYKCFFEIKYVLGFI